MCPSELPKRLKYFPLKKFDILNIGSLGTEIRQYFLVTLSKESRPFSGSERCSKTSVQIIRSKELFSYGRLYILPFLSFICEYAFLPIFNASSEKSIPSKYSPICKLSSLAKVTPSPHPTSKILLGLTLLIRKKPVL